jgi:polyphosphate kinase
VKVNLLVRGFCCVRPNVKNLSENILVRSVLGRFLEHSRIFYFRNGAENPVDGEFYIGSADWMYRNLHARVECIVPILNRELKARLWEILQLYINDQKQSWEMQTDGSYKQRSGAEFGVQEILVQQAQSKPQLFEESAELTQ